jgi:diguanylate cyclase (GGDEF)-like protein
MDQNEQLPNWKEKYEQTAIISCLAEDFDCVSYVDLVNQTVTDPRPSRTLNDCIDGWSETENYTAKMMLFANALVVSAEREDFLKRVQLDNVRRMLAERPVSYVDCRVNLNGKDRVYQLKLAADPARKDHVVIGYHSIDVATAKRRRSMVQGAVLDGLTSDFECVAYVEMAENRVTTYRVSEVFARAIPGWRSVTDYAVRARLLADALVVDEDRDRFLIQTSAEQVMKGIEENKAYYVAFRIRYEDGMRIYQVKYIRDPNDKNGVVLGVHNVDTEKRRELERHAQEEATKQKSDFLTQMSNDILSPLKSIQTVLRNARENLSDTELLQASMEKADVTAQYLYSLVNDVLDVTRDKGDGFEIHHEPMNMRVFAKRCCAAVEEQAAEKNIRLNSFIDDIAHPYVLFDTLHLRQIILNLLNNSMKYTPPGGQVTFRVTELMANDRSATFKIDIADTGHGMDRRVLEHIWDVFALRADAKASDNSGTGLGLAVCKMLADMMGATITVDSKIGEGSCFSVLLPMELDPEAYSVGAGEDTSILNGMHVLLADDNELSRNILEELLRDSGAILTPAENGKAALEKFNASAIGEYDVVLMDNVMPVMDGITATHEIRALPRADSATVTIIGMSGGLSDADMARFQSAGISAYLDKPLQVPPLVNTLLTCIHSRSQRLEQELAVATESSTRDALTGVRNRTAYERVEKQLDAEIAAGKAQPFAFAFCDVNNLKYTNDTFGHERGDELIRNACRLICEVFKHSMVFRVGGDEFVILVRGADYEDREALKEKLNDSADYGNVAVACGMAVYDPETDRDMRGVFKRADAMMYENKRKMKEAAKKPN